MIVFNNSLCKDETAETYKLYKEFQHIYELCISMKAFRILCNYLSLYLKFDNGKGNKQVILSCTCLENINIRQL